jgi:hypothetical protein
MLPILKPGSLVRLEPCTSVRVGDVVAYELGGRMFTHRVVYVKAGHVVCRGDNLLRNDPAVPVSDVLGRAVDVVGGRPRLQSPVATSYVRFRWVARSISLRVRHVRDEVLLLAREARGEGVEAGGLSAIGLPDGLDARTGAEASNDARVPPAGLGPGAKMIPAGVFSRLPRVRRLAVLGEVGPQVTALAFSRTNQSRVERGFTQFRAWLESMGIGAGDQGDNAIPAGMTLPPGYIHYFTKEEFSAELSAAFCGAIVSVRQIESSVGSLLIGSVGPRNPEPGSA